jgi:integral membrane protein (TIGR00529 family)
MSLGNAFLLGAIALGVVFGLGPSGIARGIISSVLYPKTIALALIVSLILVMSDSMEAGGQMKRLLDTFQGMVTAPHISLVVFPALIGLLPMPGGAVFSAPMVKELGIRSNLGPDKLSYINYWFRHIWEYWWPLYPGILLATSLADVNLWTFISVMFPLTIASFLFGYLPVRDMKNASAVLPAHSSPSRLVPFLKELIPILIVIIPGIGLGAVIPYALPSSTIPKEIGLIIALCIAIAWIWQKNNFTAGQIRKRLTSPHILNMVYMVAAIFIFKGLMESSNAVAAVHREFTLLHVPLVLITIMLPFLVGSIVGITVAFVGSTFPILLPLIYGSSEAQFAMAYIMLALASGFIGVLMSPLHLCLLLSNKYFGTGLSAVYRLLLLPCACFFAASLGWFEVVRWIYGQ